MNSLEEIPFWKVQGAGNDFIVFDVREAEMQKWYTNLAKETLITALAARRFSVGADGVVFIQKPENDEVDFSWDFFNADGSRAKMCGNAARAIVNLAAQHLIKKPKVRFETDFGIIDGETLGSQTAQVTYALTSFAPEKFDIGLFDAAKAAYFVNTSVPHIVLDLNTWPMRKEWRPKIESLRRHPRLGTEGANVTLINRSRDGLIRAVTFERGVEDFTLSCGTGVVAAAIVGKKEGLKSPIQVSNPGGTLEVSFSEDQTQVSLKGPAIVLYKGVLFSHLYAPGLKA